MQRRTWTDTTATGRAGALNVFKSLRDQEDTECRGASAICQYLANNLRKVLQPKQQCLPPLQRKQHITNIPFYVRDAQERKRSSRFDRTIPKIPSKSKPKQQRKGRTKGTKMPTGRMSALKQRGPRMCRKSERVGISLRGCQRCVRAQVTRNTDLQVLRGRVKVRQRGLSERVGGTNVEIPAQVRDIGFL